MGAVEAFAREMRVPTIAAHEVTYLSPADHRLHEVFAATASLSALPGPGYRPTDRLHLIQAEEAIRIFRNRPGALRNAAAVAERCAGAVRLEGQLHLPAANLRQGEDQGRKLLALALKGARERYRASEEVELSEVKARLRREISCIVSMGFAGYFLIAHEATMIAKERGIPVTGRGSAANSLVAYCLGLTRPEPFSNRLLFERFLHEQRKDPPDIDLDLCSRRRDEVRDELMGRYERSGAGAAVAATAGTLSLRGAVRVAARALGHPPAEIDALSRHVPRLASRASWEEALLEPAMRGHPLQDRGRHRLLLELSEGLSGRLWRAGTHLGGVVFGTEERSLSELVPLEPSGRPGLLRCQYDKDDLEYVGLPKLDLLGLRMHTALAEAGELVSRRLGKRVDPLSPPPNDKETYRLIRSGKTAGMFQLESPGQAHLSARLRPRRFSDLVAQISLFRPGPVRGDLVAPYVLRRNGEEPYSVPLPELEEVLRPTYGVLLYQEQVLEIARRVAGFTLAEGDLLRRAMTKDRGPGAMRELRAEFLERAQNKGVPRSKAAEVFSWIEGFSVYGFSAAHAASFAELSYASAYLRAHFPAEFFCGLLNSQPMGFYSPRVLLNEARRAGIEVLPPDLHLSGGCFSVEDSEVQTALRVGLRYCRGLSRAAISSILSEREVRPFASLSDLYRRTAVDRGALENLVRSGFLDGLGRGGRPALLREIEELPDKPRRGSGRQSELPLPHPGSWWEAREGVQDISPPSAQTDGAVGREERRLLGLDVRRHSLSPYRQELGDLGVVTSDKLLCLPHRTRARVAGIFECLQSPPTRSGKPVWFLLLEDEAGLLQATIFADVYEKYGPALHQESAFVVDGRVEQDPRRGFAFLAERVLSLRAALDGTAARDETSRRSGRKRQAG